MTSRRISLGFQGVCREYVCAVALLVALAAAVGYLPSHSRTWLAQRPSSDVAATPVGTQHLWTAEALLPLSGAVAQLRRNKAAAEPPHSKAAHAQRRSANPRVVESYGRLPLAFERNDGQTDSQVKFISRGRGYAMFLTGDSAVLTLRTAATKSKGKGQRATIKNEDTRPFSLLPPHLQSLLPDSELATDLAPRATNELFAPLIQNPKSQIQNLPAPSTQSPAPSTLHMKLVGANPKAKVTGLDPLPGKSNYFIGNDPKKWRTNVPTYAKVKYESVYPGIDLVYYGNQRQLEYDFVVAPGADPSVIAFEIEAGNSKLENRKPKIDSDGDLVVSTDAGEVRLHKPVVYQPQLAVVGPRSAANTVHRSHEENRQPIEGKFVLTASNQVRFHLGPYDKSRRLIIDPSVTYVAYFGGSGLDIGLAIAVDSVGSAYVTGITESIDFPTVAAVDSNCGTDGICNPGNPYPGDSNLWGDAFVSKVSADGSFLTYSTYLGGGGFDRGNGIAVDGSGSTYIVGTTCSLDFPAVNPLPSQSILRGVSDAFIVKMDPTGSNLMASTYLGGASDVDFGTAIALDSSNNVYVAGVTASLDFPTTSGAYQTVNGGLYDAFVAEFSISDTGFTPLYSTFLGGGDFDFGISIALDASKNVYTSGYTGSYVVHNFPTTSGALQPAYGGGPYDAFVSKITPAGNGVADLVYSTYLGGSNMDLAQENSVAVDSSGNIFVAGYTESSDFVTKNAYQPSCNVNLLVSPPAKTFLWPS